MNLTQSYTKKSTCGKVHLTIESTMPLGELHDFLLETKGEVVERMVLAQKQEVEYANSQKEVPNCEVNNSCCSAEA